MSTKRTNFTKHDSEPGVLRRELEKERGGGRKARERAWGKRKGKRGGKEEGRERERERKGEKERGREGEEEERNLILIKM